MRSILEYNKKGDFTSTIYAIIILVVVGILLLFMNRLNNGLYSSLDEYFNESSDYNNSLAHTSILDIQDVENSAWDYAFFAILAGFMLSLVLTAYASRFSAAFFWIYIVLSLFGLILSVGMSNMWQQLAQNPEMTESIARFPIMNAILGSYYPTVILAISMFVVIVLFGKRQESII